MALDVHLIEQGRHFPYASSYAGFGFDEGLSDILTVILADASLYPRLARLREYYDDTLYENKVLEQLSSEINHLLPKLPEGSLGENDMKKFYEVIQQAIASGRNVMLFAD